ncbi:aldehyde dehydrogenase family protein [Streptomyces tricolor]|nr:aldehyde dehydrogenase family protein [Streptomyces tricolor]
MDEAGGKDTVEAVAAARRAFDTGPWPRTPAAERADLLLRVAGLLARDKDALLARAESLDTGKRLVESARTTWTMSSTASAYFGRLVASETGRVIDTGRADVDSRVV